MFDDFLVWHIDKPCPVYFVSDS